MAVESLVRRMISIRQFGNPDAFNVFEKYIENGIIKDIDLDCGNNEIKKFSNFVNTRYYHKFIEILNLLIHNNEGYRTEDGLRDTAEILEMAIKNPDNFDKRFVADNVRDDDGGGGGSGLTLRPSPGFKP